MASRVMRKLIEVMMDLIVLIYFEVKAINLATTPYHPFKLDILFKWHLSIALYNNLRNVTIVLKEWKERKKRKEKKRAVC